MQVLQHLPQQEGNQTVSGPQSCGGGEHVCSHPTSSGQPPALEKTWAAVRGMVEAKAGW